MSYAKTAYFHCQDAPEDRLQVITGYNNGAVSLRTDLGTWISLSPEEKQRLAHVLMPDLVPAPPPGPAPGQVWKISDDLVTILMVGETSVFYQHQKGKAEWAHPLVSFPDFFTYVSEES
jgi:hypothetical protein